jgi:4-amino-4-deoxy-L-arabinose transferase-like glycosyltransferase
MPESRPRRVSDTAALWLTGLAFTAVHIAGGGRYGFHRDELLSYTNARHLDWCYVVYPPLTAWFARAELALFGTSLIGFRFFAAIAVGLVGVLAGLIARELGGSRRAMLVACVATSIAGPVVFSGAFLSYMSFDLLWWVAVAWCVARLLRSNNARWWLGVGAAIGLGFLTKYTILFLAPGVLGGMLLTPNRKYLRSGWFWGGVAVAIVLSLPVDLWQVHHHFVGYEWMKSIHARDVRWGRADYFLLNQFWKATNPVTVPLWCAGLWYLFGTEAGKQFRMLGWMYAIPLVLFLAAHGRDYYLTPAYPMLMAAGAVWGEGWIATLSPRGRKIALRVTRNVLIAGTLFVFAVIIPVAPINSGWWRMADAVNDSFNMQIGWPDLAKTVAQVRDSLPAGERTHLGILAGDEGSAGAVNLYGQAYGLPEAISGMNSNWLRGYGNPAPQTVIAVRMDPEFLTKNFQDCTVAAHLTNPYGVVNETIGGYTTVYVCSAPVKGWPEFWKDFQYYG